MQITTEVNERVILVAVVTRDNEEDIENSIDELEELATTAGAITVGRIMQNRERVHPGTFVGKGKIQEIKELIDTVDANGIICDNELSPAQIGNLEEMLEVKVMDRTLLILDIFAHRANTKEGIIQVELAQLQYRLSKLSGLGKSLSRLGAGIGTRGPGEKKLETDRRHIRRRLSQLRSELEDVKNHRKLIRDRRDKQGKPKIALVGYTNAGKSSLLNKLTGAEALVENKLFATLDPTTRQLILPNGTECMLIDTVGFISKLPHQLIKAFRSTLEEAVVADMLLHVVDSANKQATRQMKVVYETLDSLGAAGKPIITAINKVDKLETDTYLVDTQATKSVKCSAHTGFGLHSLLESIEEKIQENKKLIKKVIPYDKAHLISVIRLNGQILKEEYENDGIYIEAYVDDKTEKEFV